MLVDVPEQIVKRIFDVGPEDLGVFASFVVFSPGYNYTEFLKFSRQNRRMA